MADFDYQEAFNMLMEEIDGSGKVSEDEVPKMYFRQYYEDNEMQDSLNDMDAEEEEDEEG